jgi:hypothetical protein
MSKYMHIAVTVTPYYQNEIGDIYPKLARHLGYLDAPLVKSSPSLYALAGRLDKLLYAFDGTELGEVLRQYREKLLALHQSIAAYLADWKLAEADKLLDELEDIFDEIETELS